jgi:hypothetical protein
MKANFNVDQEEDELHKIASRKLRKLKAFYSHAFMYIIGVTIYILKEYFGAPFNFFPIQYINIYVMGIWTTVFLVSAIDLLATHKIFGDKWEERKIKSMLDKKTKTQKWE